jgi:hypothetical protein
VSGSPIRTPWDHSSVDSSPRPIAASHVLHRLLVPRHPPCALSNLTTKMLASTVQFSTNTSTRTHTTTTTHHHTPTRGCTGPAFRGQARGHHPKPQTPHPHLWGTPGLFLQDPTGCPNQPPPTPHRKGGPVVDQSPPSPAAPPETFPHPYPGRYSAGKPLPIMTSQCLRQMSTPPPSSGAARAPPTLSGEGAP